MGVQMFINFDNPSSTFRPGNLITGNVSINTSQSVITKGLTLSFHGVGCVAWSETRTERIHNHHQNHGQHDQHNHLTTSNDIFDSPPFHRQFHPDYDHHRSLYQSQDSTHQHPSSHALSPSFGDHHHHHNQQNTLRRTVKEYRNNETYLSYHIGLPVGASTQDGNINDSRNGVELPAGYFQQIPFSFQLPTSLPSTCKLSHGEVKYYAEASLKVKKSLLVLSIDLSETVQKHFTILGSLDLSLVNEALSPIHLKKQRQFGGILCLCCCTSGGDGEFVMEFRLARTGFIAGESIMFNLNFNNDSEVTVREMKADLSQIITFITFGKERKETKKLNVIAYSSRIAPGSNGTWSDRLKIPESAYLTDLGGCKIITVRYLLTLKAKASFLRKVSLEIPITVGTVSDRIGFPH